SPPLDGRNPLPTNSTSPHDARRGPSPRRHPDVVPVTLALLQRAQSGDRDAYAELYRIFQDPVTRHVTVRMRERDRETIHDLLQLHRHGRRGVTERTAAPGFTQMEKADPVILATTGGYQLRLAFDDTDPLPGLVFVPQPWITATRFEYLHGALTEIG